MEAFVPPLPTPPEVLDEECERPPWPWWYGPVAFLTGTACGLITTGIAGAAMGVDDPDEPAAIVMGTVLGDVSLVVAALVFASFVERPKP
jgi:hypothetical protein